MNEATRPRPVPGQKTVRELRVKVCRHCGYAISDTGLCSYECGFDGDHGMGDYFYAIYERTDKFIRDENA